MADLFVVEFKGHRKEFFYNTYYHRLSVKDHVVIQAERGEDVGVIRQQIRKEAGYDAGTKPKSILRRASGEDLTRLKEVRAQELSNKKETYEVIRRYGLAMKIVDVELQFDGNKMTIFFTADHRVDFRTLVKELASKFRTRIEMRQIGVRDEARRVGGYGICGKEQCCTSFLGEFKPISTADARVQDLALNPTKISGNCGRLLCCLKYEAALYAETKRKFPYPGKFVETTNGNGVVERIDYFREEAVIRNEEGVIIRAKANEITKVEERQVQAGLAASAGYDAVSEEELKRLEETDNSH
jgi:cell fate regulator YaaT (PSP1 superfamily)